MPSVVEMEDGMKLYRKFCHLKGMRDTWNDPLFFVIQLTIVPMGYKIVRMTLLAALISCTWAIVVSFYYLLSTFDQSYLLQYGSTTGYIIFVSINLCVALCKFDEINDFTIDCRRNLIPLEIIDDNVYVNMMNGMTKMKGIIFANYLLAGVSSVSLILSPDFFYKKVYCFAWVCQNIPRNCEMIIFINSLFTIPVFAVQISLPALLSYFGVQGICQITILNQLVKNICESNTTEKDRYNSGLYQNIVQQKLKLCMMLHNELIRMSLIGANILNVPIMIVYIGSIILGSSLILQCFTLELDHLSFENVGILCSILITLICGGLYITTSQLMINESEQIHYSLTQLPWYYMNKENTKMFSIFLRKAEKPISFYADLIEINFVMVVRIFRSIYSAACVLVRFFFSHQ